MMMTRMAFKMIVLILHGDHPTCRVEYVSSMSTCMLWRQAMCGPKSDSCSTLPNTEQSKMAGPPAFYPPSRMAMCGWPARALLPACPSNGLWLKYHRTKKCRFKLRTITHRCMVRLAVCLQLDAGLQVHAADAL